MVFVLCLAVSEKITWRECVALAVVIFTAGIWHGLLYSELNFRDVVFAGLPRFDTPSDTTEHLSVPFWLLGAVSVLIPVCSKSLSKWFVPVLSCVAGIMFTSSKMYSDKNYIDEMRMVRYASEDNWKEVISVVEDNKKPTNTMMFLRNVALMNEGGLLDRSFKLGNEPFDINNRDSIHVTLLDIASPLVYYNYGVMNEAIRLNFEMAIQAGFSPFYLKTLARCAKAVGDDKLVERYTTILHHSPFYGDWQPAPVSEKVKQLQHCYPDEISGVERTDSYLVNVISLWADSCNKVVSEQALFFSMMRCDSQRFWASLRNYVKTWMSNSLCMRWRHIFCLWIRLRRRSE